MELPQLISWNVKQYGKFSPLIFDYLTDETKTRSYFDEFPTSSNLIQQSKRKLEQYKHRQITQKALENQLSTLDLSEKQKEHLEKFKLENSVTITTGHQLNLLSGPLYFFYKIIQVVKCCDEMNQKHPEFNFIPIFWMATEDHDFEEINHFYFKGKKISWDREAKGAVGRFNLDGIDKVFEEFFTYLPDSTNAKSLKNIIQNAYLNSSNLTEATTKLVQQLFGHLGLLMIDGDDKELKKLMIPAFEEDLLQNTAFQTVNQTNQNLTDSGYGTQVHPREINLFYLGEGSIRERIVLLNGEYHVLNSDYRFSQKEILEELHTYPEKFSPNVLLRPLYQETILPNVAYIGGAGECAYWLQLKDFFESQNILYPLVVVRNSLLLLSNQQKSKLEKLGIDYKELFLPFHQLLNQNIGQNSKVEVPFEEYESQLMQIFDELEKAATQTDVSFSKMVNAQRKRQLDGFEKLKKRLIKAEKRQQSERVGRISQIYSEIFPSENLQERVDNFSAFYLEYHPDLIDEIYRDIQPLEFRFTIKSWV